MSDLLIRTFRPPDEPAVVALWERVGLTRPWNDPHTDIARKLEFQPDFFFVGECEGAVVASAMAGYEGHRGWVNYLAVEPALRGRGYGRALMDAVEVALRPLGCQKINLQVRESNEDTIAFYEAIGYRVDAAVSLGKRLDGDEAEKLS